MDAALLREAKSAQCWGGWRKNGGVGRGERNDGVGRAGEDVRAHKLTAYGCCLSTLTRFTDHLLRGSPPALPTVGPTSL